MNIIKIIKHWYYYWRFRFLMWKLKHAMNNISRSLAVALTPSLESATTAISALGEELQRTDRTGEEWPEN